MVEYLLGKDRLIGHELVEETFLFRKKFYLKGVYYNELMKYFASAVETHESDLAYGMLSGFIKTNQGKNIIDHFSLTNGGNGAGKTDLERRINVLQYKFTDSYLKKALKILEEIKDSKN
ncbi:Uncharacterised protein [uncultured archaeon]|nr:Uncharacterised protein [uncultured archaeon]